MTTLQTIAVFGASGATGKALLARLDQEGVAVRALVRKAGMVDAGKGRVEVVQGSLSNGHDVSATLQGCTAAICVFGPRPPYVDVFCEQATANIVAAMRRLGMTRLVCQTGGMIGAYRANRTLPFEWMAQAFNRHAPQIAADREGQERVVRQSGLAWTIVKPPRLTDAAPKGWYTASMAARLGMLSSITRADLADFLVAETLRPRFVEEAVFVRN